MEVIDLTDDECQIILDASGNGPREVLLPTLFSGSAIGGRNASWWFLTYPQCGEYTKVECAEDLSMFCDEWVVASETHSDGSPHLHAVVHSREDLSFEEFRYLEKTFSSKDKVPHIEQVKRQRDSIRYTCKEDFEPTWFGNHIKVYLPFAVLAAEWVKTHREYNTFDPFVAARPQYYRFLEKMHADYWAKQPPVLVRCSSSRVADALGGVCERQVDWARDVFDWGRRAFSDSRRHKMPQLYLFGEPNVGKTTLIRRLFDVKKCYVAGLDKWWMAGFNENTHTWIWFDEFDYEKFWAKNDLLKLLAGEPFVYNVKYGNPRTYNCNVPVVMSSNNCFKEDEWPNAFLVRCEIIEADEKCY